MSIGKLARPSLFFLTAFYACQLYAANFNIGPVNIFLAPGHYNSYLTITNTSSTTNFNLSVSATKWSQHKGKDLLTPTKDIIVYPPIARIKPGQPQIFRIGLIKPLTATKEQTYRLIFKELPHNKTKVKKKNSATVTVYYKISVPVFVQPQLKQQANLANLQITDTKVGKKIFRLGFHNGDKVHMFLSGVKVLDPANGKLLASSGKGFYLLNGKTKTVKLRLKRPLPAKKLTVKVLSKTKVVTRQVQVKA